MKSIFNFNILSAKHPDYEDERYGLQLDDQIILEPIYHAVWAINNYLVGFRLGSRFGIIKSNGQFVEYPTLIGVMYFFSEDVLLLDENVENDAIFAEHYEVSNEEYLRYYNAKTKKELLLDQYGNKIMNYEFDHSYRITKYGNCFVQVDNKIGIL